MYTTFGKTITGPRRLICYPYAGAGAGIYHGWAERFADLDVAAARLPGRDNLWQEPAITDFATLIEYLLADIWPLTGVPFTLFGHSMGGLVAYEIARRLQAAGRPPALLVVSASDAPKNLDVTAEYGDIRSDTGVLAAIRRHGGTPDEALANEELMRLIIPVMRADLEILDSYRCRASASPLRVPTYVYCGSADRPGPARLRKDWEAEIGAPVALHEFPGGHFFVHTAQEVLLKTLSGHIDEVMATNHRPDAKWSFGD
jgi:medium-chain acyl-[acyl-carrier-protein] hydrolase